MGHPRYFGNVPTTIQRETSSPEGASDVTMSDAEFFCMSNRTTKLDLKAMYMFDAVDRCLGVGCSRHAFCQQQSHGNLRARCSRYSVCELNAIRAELRPAPIRESKGSVPAWQPYRSKCHYLGRSQTRENPVLVV